MYDTLLGIDSAPSLQLPACGRLESISAFLACHGMLLAVSLHGGSPWIFS